MKKVLFVALLVGAPLALAPAAQHAQPKGPRDLAIASPESRSAMAIRARRAADTAVTISAAAPAPAAARRRFADAPRKPWSAFMFSVSSIPGNGAWAL